MSDKQKKHINYGDIQIDICFFPESIAVSATYDYMDYGTGNRLGRIHGSKSAMVPVKPNQWIVDLRKDVLKEIARIATYPIREEDLPLSDFERYAK